MTVHRPGYDGEIRRGNIGRAGDRWHESVYNIHTKATVTTSGRCY